MLEAVHTDLVFTISLKRSTQNLQLSTSSPADYPIYTSHRYRIGEPPKRREGPIADVQPWQRCRSRSVKEPV
jgi:hypothetical protein